LEEPGAAVRRSPALHSSGGTCHVARCHNDKMVTTMAVF
jgi:hypothetical protein